MSKGRRWSSEDLVNITMCSMLPPVWGFCDEGGQASLCRVRVDAVKPQRLESAGLEVMCRNLS